MVTHTPQPAHVKKTGQPTSGNAARRIARLLPWAYGIVLPMVMGLCLYGFEQETLFRIQELNLFLPDRLFYETFAAFPGGTLQWAACFFTQFFYHPAAGVAWLTAFWIAACLVMRSAFRLSGPWSLLPGLVPAALLAGIVQMGYFIYYIKLQGYFFAGTLGILSSLAAVWVFSRLFVRNNYAGMGWMVLWTVAGYPLFGAYALAGTAYMAVLCWRMPETSRPRRVTATAIGVLLGIGVPLLAYRFCYSQTAIGAVYTAALPSFNAVGGMYPAYRIPYYVLLAAPIAGALAYDCRVAAKGWMTGAAQLAVLAAMGFWLKASWYVDENFRCELRMARAIDQCEWEKIPALFAQTTGEPTRLMVMNKNLALFRLGRAGDEMFQYREGGASPDAPFLVRLAQVGGKALYYHYGQENYCYRWCMEDGVTYGWKVEYLKYMAKTSIAGGDYTVARKYLAMLKRTLFHRHWAEKYETYVNHPETIRESEEFRPILSLMPEEDRLNTDMNVIEMFLLRTFAYGNSDDPVHQEQNLIAALQMKDIGLFWPRFFKYATLHNGEHMPRHYQEAAYLYGHLENNVDISHMPFDAEVKDSYARFMALTQQCAGMTEAQMAEAFRPQFGGTFYYFYFLVNGLQTY